MRKFRSLQFFFSAGEDEEKEDVTALTSLPLGTGARMRRMLSTTKFGPGDGGKGNEEEDVIVSKRRFFHNRLRFLRTSPLLSHLSLLV